MALIPPSGSGSDAGTRTPAPTGLHPAVCVDAYYLGVEVVEFDGKQKEQHKVMLVWELDPESTGEHPDFGGRFRVNRKYTFSYNEKANLAQDLESWRGKALTPAEREAFDLESVVGKPCLLNIVHRETARATYANVAAVLPLQRGMTPLAPSGQYERREGAGAPQAVPSNAHAPAPAYAGDGGGAPAGFPEDDGLPF